MARSTGLGALLAAALLAPAAVAGPGDPVGDAAREEAAALLARGRSLAAEGKPAEAWAALSASLRACPDQPGKDAARDVLLALPTPPAPSLTPAERAVVVARIDDERSRYLRDRASALLGAGRLRGALRILEVVRGTLEEESTAKVLGDPKAAERRTREADDLRARILGDLPPEERRRADEAVAETKGDPVRLLRAAEGLRRDRHLLAARRVLTEVVYHGSAPEEPRARARAALATLEPEILADMAPEERKAVDEALGQPAFHRLQALPSLEFIFIGDGDLLARIPERSRYWFDLAYLVLTDLAGRVPNPEGDRVTVFFKELWDFGGGVGGGKRIDIGRADPRGRAAVLVSTGLLYHELSHCVFDLPGLPGWTEGIANFGAAFCSEVLKQETDPLHSARGNLDAFRRDYLDREERFWRMAPYGPSAGWFLHWIDTRGRVAGGGYDWVRYGRIFRAWSALRPPPETPVAVARTFAHLLAREFGDAVWADLETHRFPLDGGAAEVARDVEERRFLLAEARAGDGEAQARLVRDHAGTREAAEVLRGRLRADVLGVESRAEALAELGLLEAWRVCGPFLPGEGGDALATPFPPEREARFAAEYPGPRESARWRTPGEDGNVEREPGGLVTAKWAYPDGTATYALTEVEVPAAVDAWAWITSAHRWSLRADDVLVEFQEWAPGWTVEDRDRVEIRLPAGRSRLLLKVVAEGGAPSFALRLTDRGGRGIAGLRSVPPSEREAPPRGEEKWRTLLREDFARGGPGSGWKSGPGGFAHRNKALRGSDRSGGVPWRKYSVRPGFPQDSPSNSLSLDPRALAKAGEDLRVEIRMEGEAKIALTLDAEEAAGGLTGWTVVLAPRGDGAAVRLERYDRLLHLEPSVPLRQGREHVLVVERVDGFLTVFVDGAVALDRASAPPLRRDGLRISTWGPEPALTRIEVATRGAAR